MLFVSVNIIEHIEGLGNTCIFTVEEVVFLEVKIPTCTWAAYLKEVSRNLPEPQNTLIVKDVCFCFCLIRIDPLMMIA